MEEHFKVESRVVGVRSDEDGMHLINSGLELVFLLLRKALRGWRGWV